VDAVTKLRVLRASGYRCQHRKDSGRMCGRDASLVAHPRPGESPAPSIAVCKAHAKGWGWAVPTARRFPRPCVVCGDLSFESRCSTHRLPDTRPSTKKRGPAHRQKRARQAALRRDRFTCQHCGFHSPTGKGLEADHVVPVDLGGSNEVSNLQTLCRDCHGVKTRAEAEARRVR